MLERLVPLVVAITRGQLHPHGEGVNSHIQHILGSVADLTETVQTQMERR